MGTQKGSKLNWLAKHLPEGMPVDSAWLSSHGYTANLLRKYEASGWLVQPTRRVYLRPRGPLAWQQIVVSLQTLLARDLGVGGRTALELQGYAHYLQQGTPTVYLYGPDKPPTWLTDLPTDASFAYRNAGRLFHKHRVSTAPHSLEAGPPSDKQQAGTIVQPWGPWNWPLVLSSPERAILELLDELPDHESFHQADMLMEGLSTLSPRRLQTLLADCKSVKVKRLFFFFADRHKHSWLRHLDRGAVDLGKGKRMLVKGGRFDPKYLMTVPGDLDGVQ
ncbi:type IV toxin-antitoxin system AbiEi family antitoxin [Hyphomicrobium sp. CS1GBMeth3]|uniref:type IV toxin-antitoxin system AbiEi family antitoxin n=1 Tax=Hyphomicrobium sp. CS1GBMeth3 TaxID=1892845 RepID=UPI000930503B|nr:type IV toxin-antitoxin system AbiEi family antitoxin [Hyphomicrobium sp. CS1GBMeth3]